jgi:aspartate/methionine/tyrosine aminotransferase
MVIPEELIEPINSLQQNMFINAPTISQTAALKCWDQGTISILELHVEKYKSSRALILEELGHFQNLIIAPADGGFYVYVEIAKENIAPGFGSVSMCETFLEEEHVAFTPGIDFEDPETNLGDCRFRISYAGGIDTARQAMERFHRFWPRWIERVKQERQSMEP